MKQGNTWPLLWKEYYGELSERQIALWSDELFESATKIFNLTDEEICDAIRVMRKDQKLPPFPKLAHLINQIYTTRKSEKTTNDYTEVTCNFPQDRRVVQLAELKRLIRIASTDDEIWNAVCRPVSQSHCEMLGEYAESVHKDFSVSAMSQRSRDNFHKLVNDFVKRTDAPPLDMVDAKKQLQELRNRKAK